MLKKIIEETKKCIDKECFIAALTLALTIPDICGKAEYPDAGNTERYIKWFNTYIGEYEKPPETFDSDSPYTSGELVYNLRNSMLHQGTPNIDATRIKEERCQVNEFHLIIADVCNGGSSSVSYINDNEIVERVLEVNLVNLCQKICLVASSYYEDNKEKFDFFNYKLEDVRRRYTNPR